MKIELTRFIGEQPRYDSHQLPPEAAELARDCFYDDGTLAPRFEPDPIVANLVPGTVRGLFRYTDVHWFSWDSYVNAIRSPIANDPYDRVYYTGDGVPRVTSNLIATGSDPKPAASYHLGVPAPTVAPLAAVVDGGDDSDSSTDESRAYVYTYVTEYGEEGPPSPASNIVVLDDPTQDTVDLTLQTISPNLANIQYKRIYRTATGSTTEFYLVDTIPVATVNWNDSVLAANLGALLATEDFDPPPSDMQGLVMGANGIAAGFTGNEFCMSEPYLPYTYPIPYRRSTEHPIVAVAATTTGFVAATTGYPYLYTGVHPNSVAERKIEIMQACVSAESMVDMGSMVIYASPDGLVSVSEAGANVITTAILKKRDWEQFYPETIRAFRYEDQYVAFYDDGQGGAGFVFEPEYGTITRLSYYATAGYLDLETDTLYLVIGGQLVAWDEANTRDSFLWRSKEFQTPDITFAAVKVWSATPANIGLKVTVDGRTVLDLPSLPAEQFKIPPEKGNRWQVELTGTAAVDRFALAQEMGDL